MSLLIRLGPAFDQLKSLGRFFSGGLTNLSTTQKVRVLRWVRTWFLTRAVLQVVVVSVAAGVTVVGVLARYFKRQNRVDPMQLRKSYYLTRRSRVSGVRSPNGGKARFIYSDKCHLQVWNIASGLDKPLITRKVNISKILET